MTSISESFSEIKFAHAKKRLRELRTAMNVYMENIPFRIKWGKSDNGLIGILVIDNPDIYEILLLTGEVIFNLRSALDYKIFEAIQHRMGTELNPEETRASQFLVSESIEKIERKIINKKSLRPEFRIAMLGILRSFQSDQQPSEYWLDSKFIGFSREEALLHQKVLNLRLSNLFYLSNIDKHRLLNVAAPRLSTFTQSVAPHEGHKNYKITLSKNTVFESEQELVQVHYESEWLDYAPSIDTRALKLCFGGYRNTIPLDLHEDLENICYFVEQAIKIVNFEKIGATQE